MNIRKIYLFVTVLIGYLVASPYYLYGSVFQTMATSINQQLFPVAQQTIAQPSDPHMQQLIRSVFAQLQNTTQTKDIGSVIDVILNSLEQHQEYSQEIGVPLVVVVSAHSLRIIAQKLYRSISFIRRSLLYWKKIDQQSLLHYCTTHIPTIWSAKFKGGFPIKQKIAQTEKLYTNYVSQLGLVSRLIHQLPQTTNNAINITWITHALAVFKKYSPNKNTTIPVTKPFDTVMLLKHIKLFLSNFDQGYNNQFQPIKDGIGLPSYFSHSFGKIIVYAAIIGGTLWSAYYYANQIGTWSQNVFNNVKNYIWSPIYDNLKAIFASQEKDLLFDEKNVIDNIKTLENLATIFKEKSITRKPTAEDNAILIDIIKEVFAPNNLEEEKIKEIVYNTDWLEALRQTRELPVSREYITSTGSWIVNKESANSRINKLFNELDGKPITAELLILEMIPLLYELAHGASGSLANLMRGIHRMDKEVVLPRKLLILTPALFTVAGTYKAGSAMYEYTTHKDYTNLKIAFKELETVTICAVNQPENDSSYGLFIFLLETLKIGVVQMLPSRYTERNELLEDLTRLESPDLTFKQRLRLIEQIRRSYSIFKQS